MSGNLPKIYIFKDDFFSESEPLPALRNDLTQGPEISPASYKNLLSISVDENHHDNVPVKTDFFNHKKILALSIMAHVIVLAALLYVSKRNNVVLNEVIKLESKPKAIKSFLYVKPKLVPKVEPKEAVKVKPKIINEAKQKAEEKVNPKKVEKTHKKTPIEAVAKINEKYAEDNQSAVVKSTTSQGINKPSTTPKSSLDYLQDLKKSINKQAMQDDFLDRQQHRSASVMHGKQIPVPHSIQNLTPAQEKEKNTIRMSDSISITRLGNGFCTIERKQFNGSPVPASNSGFACGESDFDKSFREHMKKVNAKIKQVKKAN